MEISGQRHATAALPPGKNPGTHCWVGLGARLDGYGAQKTSYFCQGSNPDSSTP